MKFPVRRRRKRSIRILVDVLRTHTQMDDVTYKNIIDRVNARNMTPKVEENVSH